MTQTKIHLYKKRKKHVYLIFSSSTKWHKYDLIWRITYDGWRQVVVVTLAGAAAQSLADVDVDGAVVIVVERIQRRRAEKGRIEAVVVALLPLHLVEDAVTVLGPFTHKPATYQSIYPSITTFIAIVDVIFDWILSYVYYRIIRGIFFMKLLSNFNLVTWKITLFCLNCLWNNSFFSPNLGFFVKYFFFFVEILYFYGQNFQFLGKKFPQ